MSEVNLHTTVDARVWAAEFCRINPGKVDEDLMVAWFANAIMAGYDRATGYREVAHAMLADGIVPPTFESGQPANPT